MSTNIVPSSPSSLHIRRTSQSKSISASAASLTPHSRNSSSSYAQSTPLSPAAQEIVTILKPSLVASSSTDPSSPPDSLSASSTLSSSSSSSSSSSASPSSSFLIGIGLGDAFGSGIEGQDRSWINSHVDFTKYVNVRSEAFSAGYSLGDWSDDTSDSIAVIRTLMSNNPKSSSQIKFTEETLLASIRKEYDESKLTRNGVVRAGFGSIAWVFEGKMSIEKLRDYQRVKDYPGNAPTMRAVPLGFLPEHLIESYAITNADITHPHPKSRAASIVCARATRYMCVERGDPNGIIKYVLKYIKGIDQETKEYLMKVDQLPNDVDAIPQWSSSSSTSSSSWTSTALFSPSYALLVGPQPISSFMNPSTTIIGLNSDSMRTGGCLLYLLKYCRTSYESLRRSMLIGGDVDSLGAIVVGIMIGRYNDQHTIPKFIYEGMEAKDTLGDLGKEFIEWTNKMRMK